jgi:nicotinic acid mononucleotide adenylyltransferase
MLSDALEDLRRAELPALVVEAVGEPRSVSLLSGSFDPPTIAHVALAEAAAVESELVVLVYSVRTLPKEGDASPPLLSEETRVAALEAVCGRGRPRLAAGVCSHGLLVDQAAAAARRFPRATLRMVVGSDKALQLLDPRWYEDRDAALEGLLGLASVCYAARSGDEGSVEAALGLPVNARWRDRFTELAISPKASSVSSRAVRDLYRVGGDVSDLVPPEVLPFLRGA